MTCHIVICNKILWTQLKVKYIWFYIYSIIIYIMQKMLINNVSKYIYIYIKYGKGGLRLYIHIQLL